MSTTVIARVDPARSRVEAKTARGHSIVMDARSPEDDGTGAEPKETLLAALAGCTAMDVASILRKKRQTVVEYEIAVTGISATEHPKVFTAITVEHRVGGDVDPEALRRSIELSATRYCPVNAMLSAVARVEHRYRLTTTVGGTLEALVAVIGPDAQRVAPAG